MSTRPNLDGSHPEGGAKMLDVIFVCTGNICRSPLAEQLLRSWLGDVDIVISSAGTRARGGLEMTAQSAQIAVALGARGEQVKAHRSRLLLRDMLSSSDLVIAMAREHRRAIVELNPSSVGRTFTLRELSRLMDGVTDESLDNVACTAADPEARTARLSAMLTMIASQRGAVPPSEATDDDVIDPYRRSQRTYELSASQLATALPAVERLVRLAVTTKGD